ncbi:MAG: hypothetical protein KF894_30640, partial [Labilithrix sp.]|nr:hypothetical protein [Labilithrix sp.]
MRSSLSRLGSFTLGLSVAGSLAGVLVARPALAQPSPPPTTQPGPNAPPTSPANGAAPAADANAGVGAAAADQDGQAPAPADDARKAPEIDVTGTAGARAAGTAPPGAAEGSGFMDTRLTWTFGDDDFLHKTGELVPLSPTFSVGERPQYRLFFDNLNSRFSGRENLTHLVMYKKLPAFIENLTTEAALVLRFDLAQLAANTGNLNAALYDTGSYLRLFYATGGNEGKTGLGLTFFPLDTDRMRLGYLYDLSWGGT